MSPGVRHCPRCAEWQRPLLKPGSLCPACVLETKGQWRQGACKFSDNGRVKSGRVT